MATRRDGREWALQIIFGFDFNEPGDLEKVFDYFFSTHVDPAECDERTCEFCKQIVRGVVAHRPEIDAAIEKYARNWKLNRMGVVDRNVMRIAVYELMFCKDVPPAVVLNEAIDLAKYFSNSDSGRFVNGILDRARRELAD
jgi:N utilization substance protein B